MGDHPGKLLRELPGTNPNSEVKRVGGWSNPRMGDHPGKSLRELAGFRFVGTPKLSELEAGAIPGWVTTLGSCSVSSQEQIREGGRRPSPERTISC
ncbi:hypothetical protein L3X38_027364 [Prunus dulcis]|uniref:Uncharacterized protein n=1 Tax=Prunus dulcis TaxID=3755 RepID=A0AAD4Z129_PRUDU|nr:hypothetical protein L3X38_027364 [Prunus dulcis]